jgi:hypothetical protein
MQMGQPHRLAPEKWSPEQRAADRAEVARTWPAPTPEQVRALREGSRPAVRRLVERELAVEQGIEVPEDPA